MVNIKFAQVCLFNFVSQNEVFFLWYALTLAALPSVNLQARDGSWMRLIKFTAKFYALVTIAQSPTEVEALPYCWHVPCGSIYCSSNNKVRSRCAFLECHEVVIESRSNGCVNAACLTDAQVCGSRWASMGDCSDLDSQTMPEGFELAEQCREVLALFTPSGQQTQDSLCPINATSFKNYMESPQNNAQIAANQYMEFRNSEISGLTNKTEAIVQELNNLTSFYVRRLTCARNFPSCPRSQENLNNCKIACEKFVVELRKFRQKIGTNLTEETFFCQGRPGSEWTDNPCNLPLPTTAAPTYIR